MAPKRSNAREAVPPPPAAIGTPPVTTFSTETTTSNTSIKATTKPKANQSPQDIALAVWQNYLDSTPQRTKLIDVFMAFLVVVGGLQFVYCVVAGNYPFNAFLSGFSATVGQFVLTASLRIQTNLENKADFREVSQERAFADYIFGSLILHFFCINFIN